MAELKGQGPVIASEDTDAVHTVMQHALGSRMKDGDGNEYIYLLGVISTVVGSWVSFDEDHVTALLAASAVGRVAIAMAAVVASRYGWYQIYGDALGLCDVVADNAPLYVDATAGRADDSGVAGDWISGAVSRGATGAAANVAIELNYPMVYNSGYLT